MSIVLEIAKLEEKTLSQWCSKIEVAGGIRRHKEDPHDIDFVVIPKDYICRNNIYNYSIHQKKGNIGAGTHLVSYKIASIEVDIYFATEDNFGAMLLFLTGSSNYNIGMRKLAISKGMKLNQYGLFLGDKCVASKTEEDIYHALGKEWKSPELRGLSTKEARERYGIPSYVRTINHHEE